MRIGLLLALLLGLAACGADGAPEPRTGTGLVVTGEAKIGVSGRL